MESIKTMTVYLPVDVNKILPAQDKDVTWIMDNGNAYTGHMDEDCGNWWVYIYDEKGEIETMSPYDFTHWLEKKEDMVCMSRQEFESIITEAQWFTYANGLERMTKEESKIESGLYINNLFNR